LERAKITNAAGELKPKHKHLSQAIDKALSKRFLIGSPSFKVTESKKILLLGSGFVARPLVDYLLRNSNYSVTIASNNVQESLLLSDNRKRAPTVPFDINNYTKLSELMKSHDIVVR
jgi:alpha-aminoadipic semialdehyde synthase